MFTTGRKFLEWVALAAVTLLFVTAVWGLLSLRAQRDVALHKVAELTEQYNDLVKQYNNLTAQYKHVKEDTLNNLSEEEFEKLVVKTQTQAASGKDVLGRLLFLEKYASEEAKKEIEKFRAEEGAQLTFQVQRLTRENDQLKTAQSKASTDKAVADKTIADLQAQLEESSSLDAKKLQSEADRIQSQWLKAKTDASRAELYHYSQPLTAKAALAELDRVKDLRDKAQALADAVSAGKTFKDLLTQLKAVQEKASADKAVADKTIADLQAQLKKGKRD